VQNIECVFDFIGIFAMLHAAFLNGSKMQDLCHFFIDYLTMIKCTLKTTINQELVSTDYFVPEKDAMRKISDARWKRNQRVFCLTNTIS
jgi:hypothetical protein